MQGQEANTLHRPTKLELVAADASVLKGPRDRPHPMDVATPKVEDPSQPKSLSVLKTPRSAVLR